VAHTKRGEKGLEEAAHDVLAEYQQRIDAYREIRHQREQLHREIEQLEAELQATRMKHAAALADRDHAADAGDELGRLAAMEQVKTVADRMTQVRQRLQSLTEQTEAIRSEAQGRDGDIGEIAGRRKSIRDELVTLAEQLDDAGRSFRDQRGFAIQGR
jgi:uncharacterized coiled-coil DUF342 family protein